MLSDEPPILTPVFASGLQPPPGAEIVKIGIGEHFLLMLTAQGAVLHAGANNMGQRGDGQDERSETHEDLHPVPLHCPAVDIACGAGHAVAALSDGNAATWGANQDGQLGKGGLELDEQECERTPGPVQGITELERVFAGDWTTFFLSRGGEVAACGDNSSGELCLGHAGQFGIRRPQRVAALCGRRITQLQGGASHYIMLEADGSVWVWGCMDGRLADGSGSWSAERGCVPIRLAAGPAVCVAAAYYFCAVVTAAEGSLLLWGYDFAEQPSPVQLPGGQPADVAVCGAASLWARSTGGEWAGCDMAYRQPFGPPEAGEGQEDEEEEEDRKFCFRNISESGLSARSVPLCGNSSYFALYLEGPGAEAISRRSVGFAHMPGVLRVAGRELQEEDLATPLSDVGVSAECVVHLLRLPRLPPSAGRADFQGGAGLAVYVDATVLGVTDPICLEVHPDASVLDLVAAAAERIGLGR